MNVDTRSTLEAALGGAVAPLLGSEQAHHNTHYRGVLADGDVFVKVIDDQPAYYTAEVRVACHLASTDIRTPRLLRHGILDDGRGWLAYEWRDLRPFTPSPPQIEHAGQLLGSLYGALDFIVTPSGGWIFLELNPNGQWAWIKPTRHLITEAIADLLTEGPSR